MPREIDLGDYYEDTYSEIKKEVNEGNLVNRRCKVVSFISRSSGRGRKRRERHVELFVVDNSYAHRVLDNEIRPRKDREHVAIDILAMEILKDLPWDERTPQKLLEMARAKK